MDVRIGVTYSPREIELQLADDADRDAIKAQVEAVMGDDDKVLWLTDRKGREVGVPSARISFVEIGSAAESRAIGFSS
ncbi:MAG: DUF3107 domain-containing protein [Microthrixaceae bacterium]